MDVEHNQEIQSLIRLNDQKHKHLIRLLVAYEHKSELHLVFPWAAGNLLDFWQTRFPNTDDPLRDRFLAIWMTEQMYGLASGLNAIHTDASSRLAVNKKHGRHGDIKPENVLLFPKESSVNGKLHMDTLKISDFGLMEFRGTVSKEHVPLDGLAASPTYRGPEWDISRQVAPSYDIWCIGCVFLEFVEWYLKGWEGVDDFSQNRLDDTAQWVEMPQYKEDTFFVRTVRTSHNSAKRELGATLKLSVKRVG